MKRSSLTGVIYGRDPLGTPLPEPITENGSRVVQLQEGETLNLTAGHGFGYAVYVIPKMDPEVAE